MLGFCCCGVIVQTVMAGVARTAPLVSGWWLQAIRKLSFNRKAGIVGGVFKIFWCALFLGMRPETTHIGKRGRHITAETNPLKRSNFTCCWRDESSNFALNCISSHMTHLLSRVNGTWEHQCYWPPTLQAHISSWKPGMEFFIKAGWFWLFPSVFLM